MNKAELIEAVTVKAAVTRRDATAVIDGAIEEIVNALMAGEEVKLSGFGIFSVKEHAARIGTNPSTNERIEIPAAKTVSFKVSKGLKAKLN